MERNQLIERVRDTADRRVIRLKVLGKGASGIDEVLEARRTYLSSILAEIDVADKERLIQSLEQLNFLMTREV
jgi:5'-methylthioadenosine phosphorylase